jgi:hypothetical protein
MTRRMASFRQARQVFLQREEASSFLIAGGEGKLKAAHLNWDGEGVGEVFAA